jgi:hypothetical protein
MNLYLLALSVALLTSPAGARGEEPVPYDLEMAYINPLSSLPADCDARVEFYRVVRPILPLVNHIVIGAKISTSCHGEMHGEMKESLHLYGASKGASDMAFFQTHMKENGDALQLLGSREGLAAADSLTKAVDVSLAWQDSLKQRWYFYGRMLTTPLLGRICNEASEDVIRALEL